MKIFRTGLSLVLIAGMLLSSLPDSVLDYFHRHEHQKECHSGDDNALHFEGPHIHCHNPHLFFEYYLPSAFHYSVQPQELPVVYLFSVSCADIMFPLVFDGRGPPVNA